MKKIGFVDYYLSEWHANNYPEWIKNACAELRLDYKLSYAWAELDVSPIDGVTTDEWCRKYGVEACSTIDELCEKSDFIVILAPSDPDRHLGYAKSVLKYGKRTYIDKTFAPDYKTAVEIFDVAARYSTPFFSSSALRYAEELNCLEGVRTMITTGGGAKLSEYIIHQCEMIVKKLGIGAESVKAERQGTGTVISVGYPDERGAVMIYAPEMPFTAYMSSESGDVWRKIESSFFDGLIKDMMTFFESGQMSFDVNETKEVIRLVEMVTSI